MNGPPVVLILFLIGLVVYVHGRLRSKWRDEDLADVARWEADQAKARAAWERQHPSNRR